MTERTPKPIVRRAAYRLDPDRRRQVLEVLRYIEHSHSYIDPDMFHIELDELTRLQHIFANGEDETPATISMTHDEVFALNTCVMAADTYAHRKTERGLCHLSDEQFAELTTWVENSERWFITPLKEE